MTIPYDFDAVECPTLYHYTSLNAAKAMVEGTEFWLSDHVAMNDTTEFTYARDRLFALLRDRRVLTDMRARFLVTATVASLTDEVGLFIGSLTARRDDLNQWRNYGDNGRGCVVAIDAKYLENDAGVRMGTVIYDDAIIDRCLCAGLSVVQEQFEEAPGEIETLADYVRSLAVSLFAMKHPGFADEREIRISRMLLRGKNGEFIDPGGNRGTDISTPVLDVRMRQSAFGQTAFVALPLVRDDNTSAITGIGFGPTMDATAISESTDFFATRGVPVWCSELPYRI